MNKLPNTEVFTSPEKMNYSEIIKPYQEAFSGPPWYEVSTCVDEETPQRCPGGLSPVSIGEICKRCGITPLEPAYDPEGLTTRFEELAISRPTNWYTERLGGEIALAAVAWKTNAQTVIEEKYPDVLAMADWLESQLGQSTSFVWLDEVFANKTVRGGGNLKNFGTMCEGFGVNLDSTVVAFRTVNEAMIRAAKRDFDDRAIVFRAEERGAEGDLLAPDRRDFIIINLEGGEL